MKPADFQRPFESTASGRAMRTGNVVGSNIANILLIIGVAALIAPVSKADAAIHGDAVIMVAVSLGLVAILLTGEVSRTVGTVMLVVLGLYL